MILIFGRDGQVAQALLRELKDSSLKMMSVGQSEANFLQPNTVIATLESHKPSIVINCSAYTAVDKAESERDRAEAINAKTPEMISHWCRKNGAKLIHFSTDYVFPGTGEKPWQEEDRTSPLNWYGESKLMGEQAISASQCQHLIFRISWVYAPWGLNFVKTMLRLMCEKEELKIVNDQIGAPTSALEVARMIKKIIPQWKGSKQDGVYHFTGMGWISWYDFACEIAKQAKELGFDIKVKNILPIASSDFPTPAKRPANSRMSLHKIKQIWGVEPTDWKKSLRECLTIIQENR